MSILRAVVLVAMLSPAPVLSGCASRSADPPPRTAPAPAASASDGGGDAGREQEAAALLAAQVRITTVMGVAHRVGTAIWQTSHPGCPTSMDLVLGHMVPDAVLPEDAWGTPFRISCKGNDPTVTSAGPDLTFGTKDDIVARD